MGLSTFTGVGIAIATGIAIVAFLIVWAISGEIGTTAVSAGAVVLFVASIGIGIGGILRDKDRSN
jgi:hypothetical protein